MKNTKLSKSSKKYIRRQKALIRQQFSDPKEIKQKISELYLKFNKNT